MKEKDIAHLEWIYGRMKFVHNENDLAKFEDAINGNLKEL